MQRPTFSRIALFIAIVLTGIALQFVKRSFGQSAVNHVAGVILLYIAVILTLRPGIPVYSGFRKVVEKVADIEGWRKATVVLPITAWSIALLLT